MPRHVGSPAVVSREGFLLSLPEQDHFLFTVLSRHDTCLLSVEQTQKLWEEDSVWVPSTGSSRYPYLRNGGGVATRHNRPSSGLCCPEPTCVVSVFQCILFLFDTESSCLCLICMHTSSDGQSRVTSMFVFTDIHHFIVLASSKSFHRLFGE